MHQARIAIPTLPPGGLEAGLDGHFGHCGVYTLVDVEAGRIVRTTTLPPLPHQPGGCLRAVHQLASHGVTDLIAGGMGARPLAGFAQAGIRVHRAEPAGPVGNLVQALLQGGLPAFTRDAACRGGHPAGSGRSDRP